MPRCAEQDGMLEVIFSIDTTGSMAPCLHIIRQRVEEMIKFLQLHYPVFRVGLLAQGDYSSPNYITREMDLTINTDKLFEFVQSMESTSCVDANECYELVLHKVQGFSWTTGSQRILVLFADTVPHKTDYRLNKDHLDWRTETNNLSKMGIKIVAVQCSESRERISRFFHTLALRTGGLHVHWRDVTKTFHHLANLLSINGTRVLEVSMNENIVKEFVQPTIPYRYPRKVIVNCDLKSLNEFYILTLSGPSHEFSEAVFVAVDMALKWCVLSKA